MIKSAIDFVDDNRVDSQRHDTREERIDRRSIHGAAGEATVIIGRTNRLSALSLLALNVRLARLSLRVDHHGGLIEPTSTEALNLLWRKT